MKKPNEVTVDMSRRRLLQGSGIALSGLVLSTWLPPLVAKSAAAEAAAAGRLGDHSAEGYGAFVRIGPDGVVTVISPKIEMGQGAQTGIAMMVAEELEVPLDQVVIQEAPPNSALYTDSLMQFQATGGSTSTRVTWEPLRRAGATARILLIQAAALQWRVAPSLCHAQNGQVFGPNGLQAAYGDLVEAAATLPLPDAVPLKTPEQFKLLGTAAQRLDTPAKEIGRAHV